MVFLIGYAMRVFHGGIHLQFGLLGYDTVLAGKWIPMCMKEHTTYIFRVKACFYPLLSHSFAAFHFTGHLCMFKNYTY
jgi:hypothetical protein